MDNKISQNLLSLFIIIFILHRLIMLMVCISIFLLYFTPSVVGQRTFLVSKNGSKERSSAQLFNNWNNNEKNKQELVKIILYCLISLVGSWILVHVVLLLLFFLTTGSMNNKASSNNSTTGSNNNKSTCREEDPTNLDLFPSGAELRSTPDKQAKPSIVSQQASQPASKPASQPASQPPGTSNLEVIYIYI